MTRPRLLASLALLAPLILGTAACNKAPDKQVQAGGEILPGSASDAMLPLDTVTSQPPLAPRTEKAPATGQASAAADAPNADAPAAPAADAPPG